MYQLENSGSNIWVKKLYYEVNEMNDNNTFLKVINLKKWFPVKRSLKDTILMKPKLYVRAVDGVSFKLKKKEILGVAGESGCGKTTTGMTLIRLYEPTGGKVIYKGVNIYDLTKSEFRPLRRKFQIIFQDPYSSLNPRQSIYSIVSEPLRVHRLADSEEEIYDRVIKALEDVKLIPAEDFVTRYPHELSGGQRQRVAIARALITDPEFIVADEPVSMLDVSIRAGVLNILLNLRDKYDLTMMFITHDLAVAGYISDKLAIMYLGKIVEYGPAERILEKPMHPYTQALVSAVPVPDPDYKKERIILRGEPPSPIFLPTGCRFWPRCPHAMDICKRKEPPLVEIEKGHYVACWLYAEEKEG